MRKLAPIILALGLTARALFGNPLESTLVKEDTKKEFDFTGSVDNKSLSLDSTFYLGNNEINLNSDLQYVNRLRLNNLSAVMGNQNFYIGLSYNDLSTETILEDSSMFKAQLGIRPFDWLDFSLTGAVVNLPKMEVQLSALGYSKFQIPSELDVLGWNLDIGKEFDLNSVKLFPWLSAIGSVYQSSSQNTSDFQRAISVLTTNIGTIAYPFDHLNISGGLDLETRYLDLNYKGTFEGQPYYPSPFNFTNTIGINFHNEDKTISMGSEVSLTTKPPYSLDAGIIAPIRNELQLDTNVFALFKNNLYLKGQISTSINFLTPNQVSIVAGIGKKSNNGNFELYYNSQSNVIGLQYSTQFDSSIRKESISRNDFHNSVVSKPSIYNPNGYYYPSSPNPTALHNKFGNTLEDAVNYVKANGEVGLSQIISNLSQNDHDGTYSATEVWSIGNGVCRDIMGNLAPYIESRAFDYKNVDTITFRGPFISHVVTKIITKDDKVYLRDYGDFYGPFDSVQTAIESVFPGAYIYDDATRSTAVTAVINNVESSLNGNWQKYRK